MNVYGYTGSIGPTVDLDTPTGETGFLFVVKLETQDGKQTLFWCIAAAVQDMLDMVSGRYAFIGDKVSVLKIECPLVSIR